MSRHLPAYPNLEHLKKQAKDLLDDLQQQKPGSKLADALHAIAVEYGFRTWPELKMHVQSLPRPDVSAPLHPLVGRWTADVSRSTPHPENPFQSAMLEFEVVGESVTITDVVVNTSGQEQRGTNTIRADGLEHPSGHGYVLLARWLGERILEALVKKEHRFVSRVTYEVAADGKTLTLSAAASAHGGYPEVEHLTVFARA